MTCEKATTIIAPETIPKLSGLRKYASIKKDKLSTQIALIERVSDYINQMVHETEAMVEERKKANKIADIKKRAIAYTNKVKPYFEKIRYNSDKLEQLVSDDLWPIPKYREMLFVK